MLLYAIFIDSCIPRFRGIPRTLELFLCLFLLEKDYSVSEPGGLSRQTIETMEPATLVRIPRARMDELFAGNAELADWGRRMAEEQLRRHEDYFADYAWRGKREQYGRMLREYPQLLQRIALKDLAAYLFLTPQSLSRIRAGVK